MTECQTRLQPDANRYFESVAQYLAQQPPVRGNPPPDVFEIGLCLAGAVSAGAYTAGVLDFLIEALDEWQAARDRGDPDVPQHRVVISALTGASAGGVNNALLACLMPYQRVAVAGDGPDAGMTGNPLYDGWVLSLDFRRLFETRDIATDDRPLQSLLDCTVLDDVVQRTLQFSGPAAPARRYFADPLRLTFSVANLRGVPFHIALRGSTGKLGHAMTMHADYMHFVLDVPGGHVWENPALPRQPYEITLGRREEAAMRPDSWRLFGETALATGAFPLALKPRGLQRCASDYDYRQAIVPGKNQTGSLAPLRSDLPSPLADAAPGKPDEYRFLCVDGGAFDNEPLEQTRLLLYGPLGRVQDSVQGASQAQRATILVDPFAEAGAAGPRDIAALGDNDTGRLMKLAGAILSAYTANSRAKPAELALAGADDIYSRYLIAPSRSNAEGRQAIASGALGGFLGFLSVFYRHHDFLLGRRNCQHFLRQHFTLPADNPVMQSWTPALRETWFERDVTIYNDAGQPETVPRYYRTRAGNELPIIPLLGSAAQPITLPTWPRGKGSLQPLEKLLESRIGQVVSRVVTTKGGFGAWLADKTLLAGLRLAARSLLANLAKDKLRAGIAEIDAG